MAYILDTQEEKVQQRALHQEAPRWSDQRSWPLCFSVLHSVKYSPALLRQSAHHMLLPASITFYCKLSLTPSLLPGSAIRAWLPINHRSVHTETLHWRQCCCWKGLRCKSSFDGKSLLSLFTEGLDYEGYMSESTLTLYISITLTLTGQMQPQCAVHCTALTVHFIKKTTLKLDNFLAPLNI